jgi:hypothetical protein
MSARAGRFFLSSIKGQRGEYPIAGEIKKCLSRLDGVGFVCPLGALAGKLSIFAGCGHGSHSEPPPTAQVCSTRVTTT